MCVADEDAPEDPQRQESIVTPALLGLPTRLRECRGVLVDSNILLDMATNDPRWSDWSGNALLECAENSMLLINPIIYAEVSIGYTTIEALNAALPDSRVRLHST
jgi:hypothetical protein